MIVIITFYELMICKSTFYKYILNKIPASRFPGQIPLLHKSRTQWQLGSTEMIKEPLFELNVELDSVEPICDK